MSKDIRSYFSKLSTKSTTKSSKPVSSPKKQSKVIVDSSDEDVIPETPVQQKKQEKIFKKRKINVLSSDSEDERVSKKIKEKSIESKQTLKLVSALDVFGKDPVKQAKVPERTKSLIVEDKIEINKKTKKKSKKRLEREKFGDKKFEDTLLDLDDDFLSANMDKLDESIKVAEKEYKINDVGINVHADKTEMCKTPKTFVEKDKVNTNTTNRRTSQLSAKATLNSTKLISSSSMEGSSSEIENDKTASVKRKAESYDPDEDMNRHEKRRQSAILYQKYLNRSGPAHHGSKDIPKGKPDCLKKLCFIRTGVLDSLDNHEFESLITNHGGKIVHSVSKKVNYLVAGEDPGPAKIEKAKSYGIQIISEDEVLNLIRSKSGLPANNTEAPSLDNVTDGLNRDEKMDTTISKTKNKCLPMNGGTKLLKNIKNSENCHGEKSSSKVKSSTVINESQNSKGLSCTSKYFNTEKTNSVSTKTSNSHASVKLNDQSEPSHPKVNKTHEFLPWTEKYKPTNIKSVIGQQGDKSNMKRLIIWLQNWLKNHSAKNKLKLTRPNPWAKNDDGSFFKAALLSGPPGIGKTTTAHLVAKELGFDVVEFNASDTRSKRLLQEELSQLLSSKSLAGFTADGTSPTRKHVVLMDEVDGMAGNEDRGGIQELINLIKNSNIPIICMCNDRNHQKMRSLVNYCFDLRFSRPRLEQIKGAMMSICFKEGIDIVPNALNEIIVAAGMDIRQILTNLSIWSAGKETLNLETTVKDANTATKDVPLGQWEVCHKVFSETEHKKMSVSDRARLFYHDYSLAPLFVQENYLKVVPHAPKNEVLKRFAAAAESISMGDLVDKQIRTSNNWSLLDVQAMCASVIPGGYLQGHLNGQIDFPGWLGKNSKKNKFNRLVSEIQAHMRKSISGSRSAVNLDYITHLRNSIAKPLTDNGVAGIGDAIEVMRSYNLLREDLDGIIELSQWPKQKDPMNMVDSKVKAAFTRAYNKGAILPYSVQSAVLKKKGGSTKQNDELGMEDNYEDEDEEIGSSPEDNDDIANDAMIKAKKPSRSTKKEAESKPASSKQTTASGSGKGRKKKK